MKAPIHSRKHIVQTPFNAIATGVALNTLLIDAKEATSAASTDVVEGAIVKAIFLEYWTQNSANDGHEVFTVGKYPQGAIAPTFVQLASLNDFEGKKNILHIHQGLTSNDGVGNPVNILRSWIKIPKGKQRFGLGDRLIMSLSNPSSNNLNLCGMAIYKEYT